MNARSGSWISEHSWRYDCLCAPKCGCGHDRCRRAPCDNADSHEARKRPALPARPRLRRHAFQRIGNGAERPRRSLRLRRHELFATAILSDRPSRRVSRSDSRTRRTSSSSARLAPRRCKRPTCGAARGSQASTQRCPRPRPMTPGRSRTSCRSARPGRRSVSCGSSTSSRCVRTQSIPAAGHALAGAVPDSFVSAARTPAQHLGPGAQRSTAGRASTRRSSGRLVRCHPSPRTRLPRLLCVVGLALPAPDGRLDVDRLRRRAADLAHGRRARAAALLAGALDDQAETWCPHTDPGAERH